MKVQICLVSAQAAPNYLAAIDPNLKPDKVILVASKAMLHAAENLKSVLKLSGLDADILHLKNEHDYDLLSTDLLQLAAQLEGHDVLLNLTGGTKLMSLAAHELATAAEWRPFYVNIDSDEVTWLKIQGKETPPNQHLAQNLSLRHYLQSYGFILSSPPSKTQATAAENELITELVKNVAVWQDAVAELNYVAQNTNKQLQFQVSNARSPRFWQLADMLEQAKWISISGNRIAFENEKTRHYANGGWLELLAMNTLHRIHGALQIQDKAIGLELIEEKTKVKNELDVAFLVKNRLCVIECKTSRLDKESFKTKANDALFKLLTNTRRIGGAGTKGMLISYRSLGPFERQLADALNIKVVDGEKIAHLDEQIKNWIR